MYRYEDLVAVLIAHNMRHHEQEAKLICDHETSRIEGYVKWSDRPAIAAQWEIESVLLEAGILSKRRMPGGW